MIHLPESDGHHITCFDKELNYLTHSLLFIITGIICLQEQIEHRNKYTLSNSSQSSNSLTPKNVDAFKTLKTT